MKVVGSEELPSWAQTRSLVFSADGASLATVVGPMLPIAGMGSVLQWDVSRPKSPREVLHVEGKECAAFAPDGTLAYGTGGELLKFHGARDVSLASVPGRRWYDCPRRLSFSRSGRLAVGTLRDVMLVDGGVLKPLPRKHQNDIRALAWSPDEKRLYSLDGTYLRVWDAVKGEHLKRIPLAGYDQLEVTPDGSALLIAGKKVRLHRLDAGGLPGKARILVAEPVCAAALAPDGDSLAASSGRELYLVSMEGRKLEAAPYGDRHPDAPMIAFHPGGKLVAVVRCGTLLLVKVY
jgi:WD40 repeat protein